MLCLLLLCVCVFLVGGCVSSFQARVENEILNYKDLAALPKVKAIYEVQQPDLISSSYQPYHRYTSDDRLDTYSYGEVLLLHTTVRICNSFHEKYFVYVWNERAFFIT